MPLQVEIIGYNEYVWNTAIPTHSRTHGAIIHVNSGSGQIRVGDCDHDVGPGHTVIYLPTEDHAYSPAPSTVLAVTVVTFSVGSDSATTGALRRLKTVRHFGVVSECRTMLDLIREAVGQNSEYSFQAAEFVVAGLLCSLISRVAPEPARPRITPLDAAMERFFSDRHVTLSEVAADLGITTEAIRRQFQRYFGDSPVHYFSAFNTRRLAVALLETDASLGDLAEEFGFYDEYHLSKAFKRHMGVSPSRYRESQRNLGNQ